MWPNFTNWCSSTVSHTFKQHLRWITVKIQLKFKVEFKRRIYPRGTGTVRHPCHGESHV